jgi:glycosyltransferase involved in cell wall biosynthesis
MIKDKITLSVIMITYAHENYIRKAIEGVLIQDVNFDMELIIADDCSPDNTESVINSFSNHPNYHWIKYTKHDENKGMMLNLVWALEKAKGKYVALCEGDDYWTDQLKLQKQINFLENNIDINLITSNALFHNVKNEPLNKHYTTNFIFSFYDQILLNRCITCSTVFRAEHLNLEEFEYFKNLKIGDIVLWALLLKNNKKGFYSNECMSVYRIHKGGVYSQNSFKTNTLNELAVYNQFISSGFFSFYEKKIIIYRIQLIWYDIFNQRDWFSLRKSLLMVFKNSVFSKKSFIILFKTVIKLLFKLFGPNKLFLIFIKKD